MAARVLQGDVFDVLPTLAPGSVDSVVTSPPYWMLRSYLPANHALKQFELGSEPTVAEYIANQVRVFDLVKVALADHGVCWLNVGDSYSHAKPAEGFIRGKNGVPRDVRPMADVENGNLCLVPQRLMIALQDAGWIVRSVVIWHKPAPMPSSVNGWRWERCRVKVQPQAKGRQTRAGGVTAKTRDRVGGEWQGSAKWVACPGCRKCTPHGGLRLRRGSWRTTSSYEPVIMLAKSASYFADGVPVETPVKESTKGRGKQNGGNPIWNTDKKRDFAGKAEQTFNIKAMSQRATANLRDVWKIAAEPLSAAICTECGYFVKKTAKLRKRLGHPRCPKCDAKFTSHYAVFPSSLVETCLRCSTSAHGYCVQCGKPWVRILESEQVKRHRPNDKTDRHEQGNGVASCGNTVAGTASKTVGWRSSCACGTDETRPGLVLDPFGGSGRTARAAQSLGLDSVIVELNPDYADMARRLIREDAPLFATA